MDPKIHYLGVMCSEGHEYEDTGMSLRYKKGRHCRMCKNKWNRNKRKVEIKPKRARDVWKYLLDVTNPNKIRASIVDVKYGVFPSLRVPAYGLDPDRVIGVIHNDGELAARKWKGANPHWRYDMQRIYDAQAEWRKRFDRDWMAETEGEPIPIPDHLPPLCKCGCGKPVNGRYPYTSRRDGWVEGAWKKYLKGHSNARWRCAAKRKIA